MTTFVSLFYSIYFKIVLLLIYTYFPLYYPYLFKLTQFFILSQFISVSAADLSFSQTCSKSFLSPPLQRKEWSSCDDRFTFLYSNSFSIYCC